MRVPITLTDDVRDLRPDVLDAQGRLKVMPASYYAATARIDRFMLGARVGAYVLPTEELVRWLASAIDVHGALEIGAGNGLLAHALGIRATDNRMQEWPAIRAHYARLGQAPIEYPGFVEKLSAEDAVARYSPRVVLAAWVTHRYDEARAQAEGNMFGVDEAQVLAGCQTYIFIGNEQVHAGKPIWSLPHRTFYPSWLYSRAANPSRDFIAIWGALPQQLPD